MRAKGIKNFENDDAMDFVANMGDEGWAYVLDAIENVIIVPDDEYLDAYTCIAGLVAMEYVAAMKSKPCSDLPQEAADWVKEHAEMVDAGTLTDAVRALKRITTDSELKESWKETEKYKDWLAVIKNLETRLR